MEYDSDTGQVQQADAAEHSASRTKAASVWFTDPPYYDAVPYADLSDFFLVWLTRTLAGSLSNYGTPLIQKNPLSPKTSRDSARRDQAECWQAERPLVWFEETMAGGIC